MADNLQFFFGFWEKLLSRVPTIGKIYLTIKQISRSILGQGKHVFEKVVLVEYPRRGIYSLGFVTTQGCEEIQKKTKPIKKKQTDEYDDIQPHMTGVG